MGESEYDTVHVNVADFVEDSVGVDEHEPEDERVDETLQKTDCVFVEEDDGVELAVCDGVNEGVFVGENDFVNVVEIVKDCEELVDSEGV